MRFGLEFLERFDTAPPHQLCGAVYSGLKASKSGVSGVVELLALVEGLAVIV